MMLVGGALLLSSGCAVLSKGTKQTVVVHSNPEGATAMINGQEVGITPFKVKVKRSGAYTIEVRKPGFENAAAIVLPVANEYEKRFFRWGVDYDLGAMTDLTPGDIQIDMKPELASASSPEDRFKEMTYRVLQADALLASKDISPADHKYMVAEIIKFYAN
jgi:hypothetical protein